MALTEFRDRLPSGEVGRIINSFIFISHPDAQKYIANYRSKYLHDVTDIDRKTRRACAIACLVQACWNGMYIESCWLNSNVPSRIKLKLDNGNWDIIELGDLYYVRHLDKKCPWNIKFVRQPRLKAFEHSPDWLWYTPQVKCRCCPEAMEDIGPLFDLEDLLDELTENEGSSGSVLEKRYCISVQYLRNHITDLTDILLYDYN